MQKQRFKGFLQSLRTYAREKRALFIIYLVMRVIVIAGLVLAILYGDYESAFLCLLVLALFLLPAFVEDRFSIQLPTAMEILVLIHIFASMVLGELGNYYVRYPYWDTLTHTTWGFLCAAIGFSLIDILNRSDKVKLNLTPLFLAIVAFCFSMTIGVIWEFFEYGMDILFGLDMQKDAVIHTISSVALDPTLTSTPVRIDNITDVVVNGESLGLGGYLDVGLSDTMEDLFVNFVGALIFSVIGYFDAKSHGGNRLARSLIPKYKRKEKVSK